MTLDQTIRQTVQDELRKSQHKTSPIAYHTHNGLDSPLIPSTNSGGGNMQTSVYDPAGVDQQLVGISATQTLTNKTISGSSNTITNIGNTSLTDDSLTIGNTTIALGSTASTIDAVTLTSNIPTTAASSVASGTNTFNLATGNVQNFTFSGSSAADSVTFALSNVTVNQIFIVSVTQNSGGSGLVTWWTTIRWAGGGGPPTLTTTGGQRDTFGFICTGTGTFDGYVIGQNI